MAIQELLKKGADVKNMMFLNVLASPEGIAFVHSKYPDLLILSGEVDAGLNEKVLGELIELFMTYDLCSSLFCYLVIILLSCTLYYCNLLVYTFYSCRSISYPGSATTEIDTLALCRKARICVH